MSETVERNNRFYEQSNGEILTENEQLKEWLKIANKNNGKLQIERDMYKGSFETMSENYFRLENIIKEVREYIEKNWISQKDADNYRFDYEELNIEISDIAVLFDILDKEVN